MESVRAAPPNVANKAVIGHLLALGNVVRVEMKMQLGMIGWKVNAHVHDADALALGLLESVICLSWLLHLENSGTWRPLHLCFENVIFSHF